MRAFYRRLALIYPLYPLARAARPSLKNMHETVNRPYFMSKQIAPFDTQSTFTITHL